MIKTQYQASMSHSFDVKLATELGSVELAIMVNHFQYWINHNQSLGRNFVDDRTWMYQTRDEIAAQFPYFSPDKVRRYTDKLVELKILRKGNFNKHGMDKTIWYCFENEEMFTIGKFAKSTGESANSTGESARAIPKSIPKSKTRGLIDLGKEETSAFHQDEERPRKCTLQKRWKLTDEQNESFMAIQGLVITDDKGEVIKEKKLAFWIKNYPLQRILDVYNEAKYYKAKSMIAYMSKMLDENSPVTNATAQANAEFAIDFMKAQNWHTPKLMKKYIKIPIGNDIIDLNLNLNTESFIDTLTKMHDNYLNQSNKNNGNRANKNLADLARTAS